MKRLLAVPALALAAAACAGPADHALPLPDGRVLNLWCDGRRGPVVVMDAGWAADSRAWGRVMDGLSGRFRVCAQDRAGAGKSSPGPLPRDGEAIARDLKTALAKGDVPGPYILVGHSLGGLNMRHFARLFPADVAALVLVDPTSPAAPGAFPGQVARSRACVDALETGVFPADRPELQRCRDGTADNWRARLSEIEAAGGSTSAGLSGQGPGSIAAPLIVLRPGGPNPPAGPVVDSLTSLSPLGEVRLVANSGHMMMFDRPDAIVDAVEDASKKAGSPR